MKRSVYTLSFALLISCGQLIAQAKPAAAAPQAAQDPLAPIAWFVGGTWVTDTKDAADGHITHVVNRPSWSPNHQAIIFNVSFNGEPHYYGFYAYNPATKKIDFYYTTTGGELTTGSAAADPDGNTLRQQFDLMHANGTTDHFRSTIERDGNDAYFLTVFKQKGNEWPQIFRIPYARQPE